MVFFRLFSLLVHPAFAADPLYTRADLEALAMIREADLGVERVYADDRTYYYLALPDGLDTPSEMNEGALTWQYVGQAWFRETTETLGGAWTTTPDYILTGIDADPDEYLGLGTQTRVDEYGRLWMVSYVDVEAAERAISSPLLEAGIDGAHGVLLSISGGSDLGLFEINEAARLVSDAAHPDANIIFGAVIDDTLGDEVRVTVIAAGFDGGEGGVELGGDALLLIAWGQWEL
jgi:hypothetical protein